MNKKILITGISGFAGSFLAEYLLSQNFEVSGIIKPQSTDFRNIEEIKDKLSLHELDLLNYEGVSAILKALKPDLVFHLAAFPSAADSFKNPSAFLTNNISGELHILEALRQNSIAARTLVVSSGEVYGQISPADNPVDEDTPFRPGNPYAVSKIAQDFLGLQYFLSYKMNIIRVRPFNHIGPRQAPGFVVTDFAKQIAEIEKGKKEPVLKVGNLDSKRDFTDVRDMVDAYVKILEKGNAGEVYNIGSGISRKISDILNMLISFSSTHIDIQVDKALLRPIDNPEIVADNTKIEKVTGWKPEISFETSLKDTLEYWRKMV